MNGFNLLLPEVIYIIMIEITLIGKNLLKINLRTLEQHLKVIVLNCNNFAFFVRSDARVLKSWVTLCRITGIEIFP